MTVIVTGLPPLLNICSSGIIPKTEPIHYLVYHNTRRQSWHAPIDERVPYFARQIGESLGYEIIIHGPYKWYLSPERVEYEEPKVSLANENNIISHNALLFLKSQLRSISFEVFPEGASCFRNVVRHGQYFKKWKSRLYCCLARIKNQYNVEKYWILPDHDGVIDAKINYNNRFQVLSSSKLYRGYDIVTDLFLKKYPEIDFSKYRNAFFHPIIEQINPVDYMFWLDSQKEIIGDSILILKYKQRSARYLTNRIGDRKIMFVPDKFSILPAEIIIRQSKMNYLGLLSSTMLSFPMERVHLIPAPDEKTRLKNRSTHSHLAKVLSLGLE